MPVVCVGCADLDMVVGVGQGWHRFLQGLVPIKALL